MEEFAKRDRVKDKIEVYTVVPDGVEPHDFEPESKGLSQFWKKQIY